MIEEGTAVNAALACYLASAVVHCGWLVGARHRLLFSSGMAYADLAAIVDDMGRAMFSSDPASYDLNIAPYEEDVWSHKKLLKVVSHTPLECERFEQVRESVNPELEVFGILRTMFDPRINLSNEVSMQLIEHFDRKVFRTCVPRNVRLAEAPSFGRPVLLHDRHSRGAIAYLALAGEILRREDAHMVEAV